MVATLLSLMATQLLSGSARTIEASINLHSPCIRSVKASIVYAFAVLGCIFCSPLATLGKQERKQVGFKSVSKVMAHEEAIFDGYRGNCVCCGFSAA